MILIFTFLPEPHKTWNTNSQSLKCWTQTPCITGKGIGSPILETSVGFRSWSRSSAVSQQVTEAITFRWARGYLESITAHWPIPNYTAWWQRHVCVCKQLAQGCTRQSSGLDSNPRHIDRKSGSITSRPSSLHYRRVTGINHLLIKAETVRQRITQLYLCI